MEKAKSAKAICCQHQQGTGDKSRPISESPTTASPARAPARAVSFPHSWQSIKCLLINRTNSVRTLCVSCCGETNGKQDSRTGHSNAATNCAHKLCIQPFGIPLHLWFLFCFLFFFSVVMLPLRWPATICCKRLI